MYFGRSRLVEPLGWMHFRFENESKSPASIGSQGKFCGHVQEFYIQELE